MPTSKGGTGRVDGRAQFTELRASKGTYPTLALHATDSDVRFVGGLTLIQTGANAGPIIAQMRTDGDDAGQIINRLPTATGMLAVQGTSGRDYKKEITNANPEEGLNRVMSLEMVNFIYKDDERERVRFGFIAEDAELTAPQYIKWWQEPVAGSEKFDAKGNKIGEQYRNRPGVDINPIVMDLLGCVQALKAEIEGLKGEIAEQNK